MSDILSFDVVAPRAGERGNTSCCQNREMKIVHESTRNGNPSSVQHASHPFMPMNDEPVGPVAAGNTIRRNDADFASVDFSWSRWSRANRSSSCQEPRRTPILCCQSFKMDRSNNNQNKMPGFCYTYVESLRIVQPL